MNFSADDVRTAFSAVAIGISLASLYFSRRSWLQSNRPIVTAFVKEKEPGNIATVYNLIVANTGNRPATNVRLLASEQAIVDIMIPEAPARESEAIKRCFSDEAQIPLLKNGEELETAFGHTSMQNKCLKYGSLLDIEIQYNDLEGRDYVSKLPLKIYVRRGFGGFTWG